MISEKMIKLAQGNSAIRAMFEEGNRLAAEFGRENVYDFSLGNPNFPAPEAVKSAIIDVLETMDPIAVHGYMSNSGFESTRSAVAQSLNRRFGTSFTAGNIIMTVGAAGGLNCILKTLLNPGDEVIAISPYFVEYRNYVSNYDGVLVEVPARAGDFQPDCGAIEKAITARTKAIIVNTPNNPTGVIYSEESIKELAAVLEKKQAELGTSVYLISDEPYRELAYDGFEVPYLTKYYKNTVVGYSWSKSLSLPGERLGYLVIPSEAEDFELVYSAAVIANRVLGFVNAPSLMQLAVERCLDEPANISGYAQNRRLLYDGLSKLGFECILPQGAFYLWVKTPTADDKDFVEAAKKYNILVVPGSSFAGPGYVRIAYCVAKETIINSMAGFEKLARQYALIK
ncbi:MAG: pyridoxal phosphate-dependent aminotransferase [Oscillospiraceae bacterium]|nr:pyridoxal phosphate-dependent aminotransferase [Oscillospiraceae bacterium]